MTGNNLRLKGDLTRRAIVSRLDAKMENPEEREFDFDAVDEVRRDRPQLVMDALTLLRAFDAAGQPVKPKAFGSFEDWSRVRGALMWLDMPDPLETRVGIAAEDPVIEQRADLFCALLRRFGVGEKFMVNEIAVKGLDPSSLAGQVARLLPGGRWDSKRAGQLLRRHKDIPYLGVTLRARQTPLKVQEYWFEGTPDPQLQTEIDAEEPL